jgi:hypothetical protein
MSAQAKFTFFSRTQGKQGANAHLVGGVCVGSEREVRAVPGEAWAEREKRGPRGREPELGEVMKGGCAGFKVNPAPLSYMEDNPMFEFKSAESRALHVECQRSIEPKLSSLGTITRKLALKELESIQQRDLRSLDECPTLKKVLGK